MRGEKRGVWSGAAHRLRVGWVSLLLIGNAVLAVGAWVWLHISDSHAWQFALSVVTALLLAAAFLWIYTTSLVAAREGGGPVKRWVSSTWLLGGIFVAYLWTQLVAKLSTNVELRAGYWNSQMSAHMRTILTYPRLVEYQNDAITALTWLLPLLLLPVIIELAARGRITGAIGTAMRVWLRWQYWITTVLSLYAGCKITAVLVNWHPTYTVRGEVISVVLRLALAYGVDVLMGCLVLAVTCELLSQASLRESAAGNTVA